MCLDGAVHPRLQKGDKNIITYSITLCSSYLLKECAILPSSGNNILPHVQLRAKENVHTLRLVLKNRIFKMDELKQNNPLLSDCHFYNLADGKALYLILRHTHWSSGLKPFIKCGCEQRDSADPNHVCKIHTDLEYIALVKASEEQWLKRDQHTADRVEWGDGTPYDLKAHKVWCANENSGVSHLGAVPSTYLLSQIRFDVFHA